MKPLLKLFKTSFSDLISVVYPRICAGCDMPLVKQEKQLCLNCIVEMPKTNFHFVTPNPIEQIFWGRVTLEKATALYYYAKGSKYQLLLHQLKYKRNKEIGIELGSILASELVTLNYLAGIDYIVPVPLHPKKEKKRGYNQSMMIAKGMSNVSGIPIYENNLIRTRYSETQTKRGRFERWENVSDLFELTDKEIFESKHILLVDDVITTGSTIEACAHAILKSTLSKVSVVAIGFSSNK